MKKGFLKILACLLLCLFLIPAATLIFTEYASQKFGLEITHLIVENARQHNQDVAEVEAFLTQNPPQSVCGPVNAELQDYQNAVCAEGSELWQFHVMDKLAIGTLIGGALVLVLIAALSSLAFASPVAQAWSLRIARPLLMLVSFIEVLVQGIMLVWLSFWGTAFFSEKYYPKLIIIAGLVVLLGIFYMVKGMFRRLPSARDVDGVEVSRQQAPALWARLDQLAERMGTSAPDHVIAGIDANFYVTEAPLSINQRALQGRKLYVSLPLLRHLTQQQADGVMVHELTHLHKGDTAYGAMLGPKLQRFDLYIRLMHENFSTLLVYYPLAMYRALFELAWQRSSRRREFIADRKAADVAGPATIVESLIKISAYSAYWGEVEHELFAQNDRHEQGLGLRHAIAQGLENYAHSDGFIGMMRQQNAPHPFDSHPPLSERMQNVGYVVDERDFAAIATRSPEQSWVDLVPEADQIEQSLWQRYESDFSSVHEESLAWRYEPVGENQIALVEKYFPAVSFTLRGGKQISLSWQGVTEPKQGELLRWDSIKNVQYGRRFNIAYVTFRFAEKQANGRKSRTIYLWGVGKHMDDVVANIGRFMHRHQIMREQQKSDINEQT